MSKRLALKQKNTAQRRRRIRAIISGTADRPRLCVSKSNRGVYLQIIDDDSGKTLVSISMKETLSAKNKMEAAKTAGALIAKKAIDQGIKAVVFDRRGNRYHGRVKAVADAAREGGLQI